MYVEKPFLDFDYLEEQQKLYNELKPLYEQRTRNFVLTGFKAVKVQLANFAFIDIYQEILNGEIVGQR